MANNAAPTQIVINAQAYFGLSDFTNSLMINYQEPNTTTCLFQASEVVAVPANSTNNQINLSTMFPFINAPVLYGMKDISNPGQQVNWGLASGGQRFNMAPQGFFLARVNGNSAPPFIIWVDNPSMTAIALLQVFVLAN